MPVNGTQILTASGGGGGPYTWVISSGAGTLSGTSGTSVIYTAPPNNPYCTYNPVITVNDNYGGTSNLSLAVNAISDLAGYYAEETFMPGYPLGACCAIREGELIGSCGYQIAKKNYFCDGKFGEIFYPCSHGHVLPCTTDDYWAWGEGECNIERQACILSECPDGCKAGFHDLRNSSQLGGGCCPSSAIPCTPRINNYSASPTQINLTTGQNTSINATITTPTASTINWTITLAGQVFRGNSGDISFNWNGKDGSGLEVQPGTYTALLQAQTANGSCLDSTSQTITITVTSNPQQICLIQVGSTVNPASGNLNHSQTLFRLPNAKFKGEFALAYNSFDGRNIPFGQGWTHSFNIQLLSNNDGSYTFIEGDGQKIALYLNGSRYTPRNSSYPALTKYSDNSFILEFKEGLFYHFNPNMKITSITDRNSNTMSFTYNANNNLTGLLDSSGRSTSLQYDSNNRISQITDPIGNSHSFIYTGLNLTGVSSQIAGLGVQNWSYTYDGNGFMLTKTDPVGFITTYSYDNDHRLHQTIDPQGRYRTISYNLSTNTTQFTEKDGGIWSYAYDPTIGALTAKTDPLGNTTQYTYDSQWNLYKMRDPMGYETSYTYDANGNMATMMNPLNLLTSYTYNNLNKITLITYPGNSRTSFTYDAYGNMLSMTDPMNYQTRYVYDSRGNMTSIINALNQTTTLAYNQNNYLTSITDPTTANTSFTYNSAGNLLTQTDPLNNATSFQYNGLNKVVWITDPLGQIANMAYDLNGNVISKTDGNNNVTLYQYNDQGQVTQMTDALNQVTRFAYGTGCPSCGSGVDQLTSLTDAQGHTTAFEYNLAGKQIKETNPLGNFKTFTYDLSGNLVSRTDEKNNTTRNTYDQLNRLTQVLYPDGTTKTYSYDNRSNMISAGNQNITYYFNYDLSNRAYSQLSVVGSTWRTINYLFNGLNNRTQMTTPDNRVINYYYDTGNRLYQIGTPQGTYSYSYDLAGRRTGLTYPNGVTTTYTYNSAGYLTDLLAQKSPSTVNAFSYTHDAVGNRISMTDPTGLHTYQYDPIYQLIQAVHPVIPTEQFSYDPVGNRQNATYNEIDGFKANTTYTYDYENRLTRVQYPGMDAQYKYDPFGRRLEKNVNGQITRYVYDGDNILNEYDGAGNIKSKYVFNLAIDDPLSVDQGGSVYYYHKDGLGSVTELTNSAGNVIKTYRYNSYGEISSQSGSLVQQFTFTGREYDSESGLYYYRARYYDPAAGIFIGKDPIRLESNDVNLFRYVGNNPFNYTDPLGLKGCGPFGISFPTPYGLTECCDIHDNCYERCDKGKFCCDFEFCRCMYSKCNKLPEFQRLHCKDYATFYCSAVTIYGSISYFPSCGRIY